MRKILTVISLLLCMFLLSACGVFKIFERFDSENCTHSYRLIETSANCTQGGYSTYKCDLCWSIDFRSDDALGHAVDEGACPRCNEVLGWDIFYYLDEFKNPTDDAYMKREPSVGTFSNSAITDEELLAEVIIDSDRVSITLCEYGSYPVEAYSDTDYKITILDEKKEKHYTTGVMHEYEDRIVLKDMILVELLKNNAKIEIYLQEVSDYTEGSTYLFSVKSGSFASVYERFSKNYNQ